MITLTIMWNHNDYNIIDAAAVLLQPIATEPASGLPTAPTNPLTTTEGYTL